MKNCKEYHEKIIFFDELTAVEQGVIREHLEECENCQAHFEKIMVIMSSLRNETGHNHLDNQLLTRFVINENFPDEADFDGKELSAREVTKVRQHLQVCNICKTQYEEITNEFNSVQTFLRETRIPDLQLGKNRFASIAHNIFSLIVFIAKAWKELRIRPKRKYILIPASGLVLLLLLFLFLPFFNRSGNIYDRLAKLEHTEISYLTRGADINLLQSGIAEFNSGNYPSSVEILEKFISEVPGKANRTFARYVCGLAYLFQVNNTLDKLKPIHHQYIDKGIEHLRSVLSSASNLRFQEDANWYIGKAYLMKEEGQRALKYFERVRNLDGKKSQKAQDILAELEKSLISTK